jgi:hypothetical protein
MTIPKADLDDLKRAKAFLENPGHVAKLTNMVGSPVERGMKMLPSRMQAGVHKATEAALLKALDVAVTSLGEARPEQRSRDRMHTIAAAASGAAGGAFGIAALAWELPLSTALMLRSIADIAATEGENPRHLETKLACLTVFALGSTRSDHDNAAESGYFAARAALASAVSEAAKHLAQKGLGKSGAPALVRLISLIGSRFGVVVSEKVAAQAVPIIGAAGGALINTLFIGHYQDMARGHFIVRRLEKIHGTETIRRAYDRV